MRVGLDISLLRAGKSGGIPRYVLELGRSIGAAAGVAPLFYTGVGWQSRGEMTESVGSGFSLIRSVAGLRDGPLRRAAKAVYDQWKDFQVGRAKLDLFHAPNYLAPKVRWPIVTTVHDLSHLRHPEGHPAERVSRLNSGLMDTIERSERVITISQFSKSEIVSLLGVAPSRIAVTYMGVSDCFFNVGAVDARAVRMAFGLPPDGGYVLSVATLEPRKNLHTLIAAHRMLGQAARRQWPLVLVGANGWLMERFLEDLRTDMRDGTVRVMGSIPDADLARLYAAATVFCYPSIYEGFGMPPVEAMAAGAPVLVSEAASLPEVCGEHAAYCEPLDETAWAEAIAKQCETTVCHETTRRAKQHAAQFTWTRCGRETAAVYTGICGGP